MVKLNGEPVVNLRHLKEKVDTFCRNIISAEESNKIAKIKSSSKLKSKETTSEGTNLVFEFSDGQFIILDAKQAFNAQDQVLFFITFIVIFLVSLSLSLL